MATPKAEPKIYTGIGLDFETGSLDCTSGACTQLAMQAVRLDTWEQTDRYVQYIYPYEKQDIGGARRKVLRNRHEQEERTLMDYQPEALNYSGISMEQLERQGADLKQVGESVIAFARKNTLSKGHQG